jgi:DNA-binding transcriptional ArsR family regulator
MTSILSSNWNRTRAAQEYSPELDQLMRKARKASNFSQSAVARKSPAAAVPADKEASVTELENILSLRQSAVSQQLARLRYDGMVDTRRDGKRSTTARQRRCAPGDFGGLRYFLRAGGGRRQEINLPSRQADATQPCRALRRTDPGERHAEYVCLDASTRRFRHRRDRRLCCAPCAAMRHSARSKDSLMGGDSRRLRMFDSCLALRFSVRRH